MWWKKKPKPADDGVVSSAPRLIWITPEGRRIVDAMSIIGSPAALQHLLDLEKTRLSHLPPSEPEQK